MPPHAGVVLYAVFRLLQWAEYMGGVWAGGHIARWWSALTCHVGAVGALGAVLALGDHAGYFAEMSHAMWARCWPLASVYSAGSKVSALKVTPLLTS
jgi:hypothetical protein